MEALRLQVATVDALTSRKRARSASDSSWYACLKRSRTTFGSPNLWVDIFVFTNYNTCETRICGLQERSARFMPVFRGMVQDRKSTRLNSSHVAISYTLFCLKK